MWVLRRDGDLAQAQREVRVMQYLNYWFRQQQKRAELLVVIPPVPSFPHQRADATQRRAHLALMAPFHNWLVLDAQDVIGGADMYQLNPMMRLANIPEAKQRELWQAIVQQLKRQ